MTPQQELRQWASAHRKHATEKFFKTGKGEYGEGDVFLGVAMPDIRKVVKNHHTLARSEVKKLVRSPFHEERMLGLLILAEQFKKATSEKQQESIYKFYVSHLKYVNNWDLVDVTAPHVVGRFLYERDRSALYDWARSQHLWTKRISIVAQWWMIRKGDLQDVFPVCEILLQDEHDLIHKAVGWMLRESAKKDLKITEAFLKKHYPKMPRTMLRYAIERFPEGKRQRYLKGKI